MGKTRSPEFWLERAEEARVLAAEMEDSASKDTMLEVAESYERLAAQTEALREAERVLDQNRSSTI